MPKPPVYPLQYEDRGMSYFEKLVRLANEYVSQDGIQLNFAGYTDTLIEYANLTEKDKEKAWNLAKDLNAWAEYFSSIANLIQKLYLDSETDKISTQALASFEADEKKVANGDRLSNKDERVIQVRKKRNTLKAFHQELEAKVKFLERAHYHCKATYDLALRSTPTPNSSNQYVG